MLKSQEQFTALAARITVDGVPSDLLNWLTELKLLVGVPFNYLVPDPAFLPPETLRFFHLDPNWVNALVDGALSIGRHYTGPDAQKMTLAAEVAQTNQAQDMPTMVEANLRRRQLSKEDAAPNPAALTHARTGFLLRSEVVKGWPNMDVVGYAKGSSPYDYEAGVIDNTQVKSLETLRLVRLSSTVMLGIFSGELYELVFHQPPEAIHFGFMQVDTGADTVNKNLRVPTTNWDDPDAMYDADTYQNEPMTHVFADADARTLNMMALSKKLGAALAATGTNGAPGYYQASPGNANYKDHLVSSDFGLEMVHGVGLVSFINTTSPSQ